MPAMIFDVVWIGLSTTIVPFEANDIVSSHVSCEPDVCSRPVSGDRRKSRSKGRHV